MALVNNGYLAWTILEGIYLDDTSLDGMIMPNIDMISPQAIVPSTSNITFNVYMDVTPSGGNNGDVWYNQPSDTLFYKNAGAWVYLTNRVTNNYYVAPVYNTGTCPIGASGASGH